MTDTLTLEPTAVVRDLAERARVASRRLALLTRAEKDAALLALAPLGRHVQIGLYAEPPRLAIPRVISQELTVLGSHGMAAVDYPGMLALIESGALAPQRLVERIIGLDEAAALLPGFDTASVAGMTIIDPTR